jgi:hypothetical protein
MSSPLLLRMQTQIEGTARYSLTRSATSGSDGTFSDAFASVQTRDELDERIANTRVLGSQERLSGLVRSSSLSGRSANHLASQSRRGFLDGQRHQLRRTEGPSTQGSGWILG